MLYENDFNGILGTYNGTFPMNAAVALHFMGFLGGKLPISLSTCIHFKKGFSPFPINEDAHFVHCTARVAIHL